MTASEPGRRDLLKAAGALGIGAAVPLGPSNGQAQAPSAMPGPANARAGATAAETYLFFNPDEAAFIEAFVDHLVPADELTPSGSALGISAFIDRQLAGAWGKGARMYLQGPWATGTPSQGYQLPLTPADLYRNAIRAVDAHCQAAYRRSFDRLDPAQREEVVLALSEGKLRLQDLPARTFFDMAYGNVMEGLFSDPIYGGNRDKGGWKLVGFPGVIAAHAENIERFRGKPYSAAPVGIADLS